MVRKEVAASQALGFNLGMKLVRGCYMVEERALAAKHGYESPIWDTIEDTHKSYNYCLTHIIENLKLNSSGLLLLGSHNHDSIKRAKALILKHGLDDQHMRVRFGQLKGFSD